MSDLPKSIAIMEVGPRDVLQTLASVVVPTDAKVAFIERLAETGLAEIEVGSFVNPKAVPQLADSAGVIVRLKPRKDVDYHGLGLNILGLQRAIENGRLKIKGKLILTCSETFSQRNVNRGVDDQLAQIPESIEEYRRVGVEPTDLHMITAFGCNYEGYIAPERVVALAGRAEGIMADHGAKLEGVALADTMRIDIDALIEVARQTEAMVGHPLPGKLMKSGRLTRFHNTVTSAASGAA